MEILIKIIGFAFIPIIISLIMNGITKHNNKEAIKNQTENHIIMRLPRALLWIGCACIAVFGAFSIWTAFSENETATAWVSILFGLFTLPGLALILASVLWKIEIFRDKDYFICRTFIKTHTVRYDECISYKMSRKTLVLNTAKNKFHIEYMATNFDFLLEMLEENNVQAIF